MNKFMGGLTLGIVLTASFFIFFNPFQKKAFVPASPIVEIKGDSLQSPQPNVIMDTLAHTKPSVLQNLGKVNRDSLILFAKSMLGTPYLYGSIDPAKGFDCSGFITYVFNHF
ncbi:MAG: NlpC/P60 family protein, partial [Ferruginibacter sp.]